MRYYLHGDVTEHDPNLLYCARCDAFVPEAHWHQPDVHSWSRSPNGEYERYRRGWKFLYDKDGLLARGSKFVRPKNARNLFA
jgi:hypothetical protein